MLDFLYHDDALVALAKPPGRIVVPGRGAAASERTLREDVAEQLGRDVFVVHRLDRGTSGVLLFAVTAEAHRALSMAFERHQIDKRYWGLCRGTLPRRARSTARWSRSAAAACVRRVPARAAASPA